MKIPASSRNSARANADDRSERRGQSWSAEGDRDLHQEIEQVHERDPDDEHARRQRGDQGPFDDQRALRGNPISKDHEGHIAAGRETIHEHQQQPQRQVTGNSRPQPAMNRAKRELGGRAQRIHGDRLSLDGPGRGVARHEHLDRSALDQEHEHGAAQQDDRERRGEREERQRLGHQGARNGRQDLPQTSLQQVRQIGAEQDGDEDRRADDGNGQKHLEGGLRGELDRDGLPVGGGNQGAAFEQQLQAQISSTIARARDRVIG